MKTIQTEYRKAVDKRLVPNNLFERTKTRMRKERIRSGKFQWHIMAPICALVVLVTISATAYGAFYRYTRPIYKPHNLSMTSEVARDAGMEVNKTCTSNKLSVSLKQTLCDNKNLYISLEVKSTDGKPLQESSEFRKSQLMREKFAQSSLAIDGKNYKCSLFRTDNASVPDKASFELVAKGDFTGLEGKSVALTLKDFTDEVNICEDAGFLFQNLGQIYEKVIPEKPQNFIRTGFFDVYADKSLIAPSWTIPAGKQKIKFSSQFPDSYIDNIGFHKTGEYDCQEDVLYISIVPGRQSDVSALKKLCFQNLDTMEPAFFGDGIITGNGIECVGFSSSKEYEDALKKEKERKLAYNEGRIVIALSTFLDNDIWSPGCSVADLSHYRIVKNFQTEKVLRYSGTWNISFTLRFKDTSREFTPNVSIKTRKGHEVTIEKISLSDLSLSFTGKFKNVDSSDGYLKWDSPLDHIKLIMKDGSAVDAGQKFGGTGNPDGSFEFEGNLQSLVDVNQVTAVELFGTRIVLNQ